MQAKLAARSTLTAGGMTRLVERMEKDGYVGVPDHVGRREVLIDASVIRGDLLVKLGRYGEARPEFERASSITASQRIASVCT